MPKQLLNIKQLQKSEILSHLILLNRLRSSSYIDGNPEISITEYKDRYLTYNFDQCLN